MTALAEGSVVSLRRLTRDDVGPAYLGWMRDPHVNRHLESRFAEQSLETLHEFVAANSERDDVLLLAIVDRSDGAHIGNVKVGPLDPHHATADLGLLIGAAGARGRGAGTEAITLATRLAFELLGARKLTASAYSDNAGSIAAFRRAGWIEEGTRPGQFVGDDGHAQDQVMFGVFPG